MTSKTASPPPKVELYDFRRPAALAREHTRVLEMSFETFARQWGTQLTSRLRVLCQVTAQKVEMTTYDEYISSLPQMTTMVLCSVGGPRAVGVVQMPTSTGALWLDYLLGGPGLAPQETQREFTDLEWGLISQVLDAALADLNYAFAAVTELDVTAKSVAYNPQFAQASAASEQVLVATFTMLIGDHSSTATVMLPAEVLLAPLRDGHGHDSAATIDPDALREARQDLARQIEQVPVEVSVKFQDKTMTAQHLESLQPGDVVVLDHRTDQPLSVVLDGTVLYQAAMGQHGSRSAVTITNKEEIR